MPLGTGMVLDIDISSLGEVGASKSIVLTRKVITLGTNRFGSFSYNIYMKERPSRGKGLTRLAS